MNNRARAFTLVELLVVVLILGVLLAMLLPSLHRAMSIAQEKSCDVNLATIGKAIQAYYNTCKGPRGETGPLPKNDDKDWGWPQTDDEKLDFLPGTRSSKRWWCNKVYALGHRNENLYKCASDSIHFNPSAVVQSSYGFNDTLTDPESKGGDGLVTIEQITVGKPMDTILVGHCSPAAIHGTQVLPGINEQIVSEPYKWPRGHVEDWDVEAKASLGRAGFLMASGDVKNFTFAQVKTYKDKNGRLKYFHTHD